MALSGGVMDPYHFHLGKNNVDPSYEACTDTPPVFGTKNDAGKLRMDLLPPDVIEGWAEILTLGAEEYTDRNWELGMNWGRIYAAALRHLMAFQRGENLDPKSGKPHIDHALCCISFLSAYQKRNIGKDDRNALSKTRTKS